MVILIRKILTFSYENEFSGFCLLVASFKRFYAFSYEYSLQLHVSYVYVKKKKNRSPQMPASNRLCVELQVFTRLQMLNSGN